MFRGVGPDSWFALVEELREAQCEGHKLGGEVGGKGRVEGCAARDGATKKGPLNVGAAVARVVLHGNELAGAGGPADELQVGWVEQGGADAIGGHGGSVRFGTAAAKAGGKGVDESVGNDTGVVAGLVLADLVDQGVEGYSFQVVGAARSFNRGKRVVGELVEVVTRLEGEGGGGGWGLVERHVGIDVAGVAGSGR